MPPSGECLQRIIAVAAMVNDVDRTILIENTKH
jgi:hypothetical protein